MLGIRGKLSLGFGGLLLIIVIIGVQSIVQFRTLGLSIDVILRENYRSVLACQQMKEALERMDSGALFILLGDAGPGAELIERNKGAFEDALRTELDNLTLPEEGVKAVRIRDLFARYTALLQDVQDLRSSIEHRRAVYFGGLLPVFSKIKDAAGEILDMNQKNMSEANEMARAKASAASRRMHFLLMFGAAVAIAFILFTGRWVLRPIRRLTDSAEEIRRGNLDLTVQRDSRDEIGRLSEVFNEMAASLREFRRSDRSRIARIQRSTQQVFNSLPEAVAVVDVEGHVELATELAADAFGIKPDIHIQDLGFDWMEEIVARARDAGGLVKAQGNRAVVQRFIGGEEHFFSPRATPILDVEKETVGVLLILRDVTSRLHQDELKRGVISTVSHQLKTPLTSLRMAVYLLLEERVGSLTPKQTELLVAARDDTERLHSILSNLLDISRIESGRMQMDFKPTSPHALIMEQIEASRSAARDCGVALKMNAPAGLPDVWADPLRIGHVLDNLLSNALKYTAPGGEVDVSAATDDDVVRFTVTDTGKGIPAQYLRNVFDQFFRAPGQGGETGEGLGLAIAREIVEAHGGKISAESVEGEGSVFTFSLRRADRRFQEA